MEFSVLMSVYAKEKAEHLELALKSVIEQTKKPDQIVLVKDGLLTDDLERVITDYLDKERNLFTIVELKENKGLGFALNEGIKECKYELVARMDSDDICVPERFEKQIALFLKNPNLDIVGSHINEFEDLVDNIVSIRKVPIIDNSIKSFARRRNPFNHVTVIYKKKTVVLSGGYEDFMWFEDYYLWVRMIINDCMCANLDDQLVNVRAGSPMFERRIGRDYAKMEYLLQKEFLRLKFTNHLRFSANIFTRALPRFLPIFWLRKIYLFFARSNLRNQ